MATYPAPSPPSSPSSVCSSRDELLSYRMEATTSAKSIKSPASDEGHASVVPARPSRDDQIGLDDLFDPNKTAKENKSTLMSYELDRMGMGRYQWCVFFLCGLGFFVDLLWAQGFGLILVPLKNEPGFDADDYNIGLLSTAFAVGLTVGAFTWGILVDVIGRRWSFNLTCLISGVFGISSGASPSFTALRVLVAFVGVGVGGNIPIDATITLEILPTNRRFLLALLSLFQPVGVLVASGIAYGFVPSYTCGSGASETDTCRKEDNMGWRYFLYTMGALTLFIFLIRFLAFSFQESPAYLINRGLDEEAIRSVTNIAKTNKSPPLSFGMDDFLEVDRRCSSTTISGHRARGSKPGDEPHTLRETLVDMLKQLKNVRLLFGTKALVRLTTLLWITYAADYFGFSIAGTYLPQILADRGASNNVPLSTTYRDYMAIYAPGIAACILAAVLIELPRLGRQWSMVVSSALMATSLFLFATVNSQASSVGLNTLEYFMQSLFNAILYAYTPEAYPSAVRGTASGLASTVGRIASIIAPIAAGRLYGPGTVTAARNTVFLGGGITLLCPVALALLPYDTRGVRSY